MKGGVGAAIPHDSGHLHVSGRRDLHRRHSRGARHAALPRIGTSERAHARLKSVDLSKVRAAPGVVAVHHRQGHPGQERLRPVIADDPIFAQRRSSSIIGQSIFAVAAKTDRARRAARRGSPAIEYDDLKADI